MADLATPSAASIATSNPSSQKPVASTTKVKPEKPDEEKYKVELAKAEKEHAAAQEKLNEIKAKMDLARPRDKESPSAKNQQALRAKLAEIRTEQQSIKGSKGNVQEKIKALDTTLKNRISESKASRSRIPFKSVDEVDREIQRLEKQVDTGRMKLVDEKKALAEISNLRKQRKTFSSFDESQKGIDEIKAQISDLKKGFDDPRAKALSEEYTKITAELDAIKKSQDDVFKGFNSLRDERTKLQAAQSESWAALRAIKDKYWEQKKAAENWEREANKARREKQKAERDNWEKEKRRKVAASKLEEASQPAYLDEILVAEGLLRHFDPNFKGTSALSSGASKFAAQATRKVEDANPKGTRLLKKDEDEDYFMGTGGKKGKKGKKANTNGTASPAGHAESSKFNLNVGIIEEFSKIGLDAPMGQSDVPAAVEKLKEKIEFWKKDQDRKTKENIAKAQKEIDKLNSEAIGSSDSHLRAKDTAKKPAESAAVDPTGETELRMEKEGAADAAEELEKVKLDK